MLPWEAPNDPKTFHMDRIHHHESFKPTLGPFRHPQGSERINFPPLKSLSGRKPPERPWSQVPTSKTFSAQRVVSCDNKDSFVNIKYAHSSRKRVSTRASISVAIRTLDFFGRISLSIATMFGLRLSHRKITKCTKFWRKKMQKLQKVIKINIKIVTKNHFCQYL